MSFLVTLSRYIFIAALAFAYGMATIRFELWPFQHIKEFKHFLTSGAANIGLADRMLNDLGLSPKRFLATSGIAYSYSKKDYKPVNFPHNSQRLAPLVYSNILTLPGYRLIQGTFDFDDTFHGVLLLDERGNLIHTWKTTQETAPWPGQPDRNVVPHGIEVLPDGSIIEAVDHGRSLTRYNACGQELWRTQGHFHHSVTLSDDHKSIWTWLKPATENDYVFDPLSETAVQVSVDTGQILRQFTLQDIIDANPETDYLLIHQQTLKDFQNATLKTIWDHHPNDIETLPAAMAKAFPQFKAGDIMINIRNINAFMVLNPTTLKIKWVSYGQTRRPHDPDFQPNGTITVFDNNMHRPYSHIYRINPQTNKRTTAIDGKDYNFTSIIQGKHQILPNGSALVTSTQQGRVFEVNPNGMVVFELQNRYTDTDNYIVSEARYVPKNYFKKGVLTCPSS